MEQRSPVHEIVNALWRALHELGLDADVDRRSSAGASRSTPRCRRAGREFHNHDHVIELAERRRSARGDRGALSRRGLHPGRSGPAALDARRDGRACSRRADGGWRVLPARPSEVTGDVLAVFGRKVGDIVTPTTGLNEFASRAGRVASSSQHALDSRAADRGRRVHRADDPVPRRSGDARCTIGSSRSAVAGAQLDEMVERAVRVGNRDVENFADNDPARFLDNTWKLLPESNPALHSPLVYTVRDYRIALQKMEGFLAWLPAERVFHTWGDEPQARDPRASRRAHDRQPRARGALPAREAVLDRARRGDRRGHRRRRAARLLHGRRQARDAPTQMQAHRAVPAARSRTRSDLDPPLHRLLAEGRASESSFDTKPSPLGAFLHATVGEAAVMKGVEHREAVVGRARSTPATFLAEPAAPSRSPRSRARPATSSRRVAIGCSRSPSASRGRAL